MLHFLPWYWKAGRVITSNECIKEKKKKKKDHLEGRLETCSGENMGKCLLNSLNVSHFDTFVLSENFRISHFDSLVDGNCIFVEQFYICCLPHL